MTYDIIMKIISTIINMAIPVILGYCIGIIRKMRKLAGTQLMDMRNDLSNKFFVYDAMDEVEDYLVMAFREKCEDYFEMGGDSWIHPMYDKSFKWKIKPTVYLKQY